MYNILRIHKIILQPFIQISNLDLSKDWNNVRSCCYFYFQKLCCLGIFIFNFFIILIT